MELPKHSLLLREENGRPGKARGGGEDSGCWEKGAQKQRCRCTGDEEAGGNTGGVSENADRYGCLRKPLVGL